MSASVWLRAGGMAIAGAAATALADWWGVALLIGAYFVVVGFMWELRAHVREEAARSRSRFLSRDDVWDGRQWRRP